VELWTQTEDALLLSTQYGGYQSYLEAGGHRTYDAWQKRRRILMERQEVSLVPRRNNSLLLEQKRLGHMDWREMTSTLVEMQDYKRQASQTQTTANIVIESDGPVVVMVLADTHVGSWSTDYELFMRITDEILEIPNLFVCLLGDMAHMAIKLRSVDEVSDNLLTPDLQLRYLESWLQELEPRVLFATWGNHDIEREESQAGGSRFADLYRRTVPYFGGIGHADVTVGTQSYRIAASHKFLGRGMNPVMGPMNYLLREGTNCDIAIAGDSHVPGIMKFTHGPDEKLAINCGSIQTMSGYARRYFSLKTHPVFPVFTLDPEEKIFSPYWSLREYLRR
jgi:predicted phosphodiesterase